MEELLQRTAARSKTIVRTYTGSEPAELVSFCHTLVDHTPRQGRTPDFQHKFKNFRSIL